MKFNLLVATSQINSEKGKLLGTGSVEGLRHLAELMRSTGIVGDIYDVPNGARSPGTASPFSLTNGFALTTDELDLFAIPELHLDPDFKRQLELLNRTHRQIFASSRTISYTLKRTLIPWIMERCFELFKQNRSDSRQNDFNHFQALASYWLEEYALFEVYREQKLELTDARYRQIGSSEVVRFLEDQRERIEFHKYVQFLCYEQRKAIHNALKSLKTGLIVNLPFGVEFASADVYFHPDVFATDYQVGCSPEPEHGYPEQAWGVAVYKERSAGLQRYLEEKMAWISHFGDGVFLDHLVGWCGQYVVPLEPAADSSYPYGHFLTEDHQERKETISWFLDIINKSGLSVSGEVAGDTGRVKATREVIEELKSTGSNIGAMAVPRWESKDHKLLPLSDYDPTTLMMVETHDTSTLLQYILNRKGYFDDFESTLRILEFCNRVLGLPFLSRDVPLDLNSCSEMVWVEICRRLSEGTPSTNVVFTLPGLISLLSQAYRSPTVENNINIKPGTSGAVGNGWRNWSYFSPPIEALATDQTLKAALSKLGKRSFRPFDYFHVYRSERAQETQLEIRYSHPKGRQIVYQNRNNTWEVLPVSREFSDTLVDLELIVGNTGEEEVWQRIELDSFFPLEGNETIRFQDLNTARELYSYSSDQLRTEKFFVRLQPGQVHHFLLYRHHEKLTIPFAD